MFKKYKTTLILFFFIGFFNFKVYAEINNNKNNSKTKYDQSNEFVNEDDLWVEVEPRAIVPIKDSINYEMISYKERRRNSGLTFGLSYSVYEPKSYTPDAVVQDFDQVYGNSSIPLIELNFLYKWNISLGSIGIDFGGGIYEATSDENITDSSLKLFPVHLGLTYTLDNIWNEPIIAPYITGGIYSMIFKESIKSNIPYTFNGNSGVSPYFTLGAMIQINWIEKTQTRRAYIDEGIENTFLFVEARQFMKSFNEEDPDFSGLHFNGGFKVEF